MCSPANIAAIRPVSPTRSASAVSSATRLVGDQVLAVVDVQVGHLAGQPFAPVRVGGEQVPQVGAAHRLGVLAQRLPLVGGGDVHSHRVDLLLARVGTPPASSGRPAG